MDKTIQKALSLVNLFTIPQDIAQSINMQQSAPRRQLAQQQAFNQADQLTNQADKQTDKVAKLNLLKRAQDIYSQQSKYAQQNAQGFSPAVDMSPLLRGGVAGAEIGGAGLGIAAALAHPQTQQAIAQQVPELPKGFEHMTLGQIQQYSQGLQGASPLSQADLALAKQDFPSAIAQAQKILTDPNLAQYRESAALILQRAQAALQGGMQYGR